MLRDVPSTLKENNQWVAIQGESRKKQRTLVDEPEDDFHLSAPQTIQNSQSSNFVFMPTPTVQRQLPTSNDPNFEIPNFEPEPDIAIKPKSISEARTRLQLRQQSVPTATRQIRFVGDCKSVFKAYFFSKKPNMAGNLSSLEIS
uniref:Uncharacterized protein n=1 Tax=Nicotiana tabacum TaxID=4097 RepID=A0A1S3YIG9_TOBAC|nr:PREDICTED: uncharacterized protein LOC107776625 [Nicotiana tabacum]